MRFELQARAQLPDKLFFRIGEVSDLVGVKTHVLRYWESEFSALRPMKTRGAHRVYRRRDVELAMVIRRLLQDEGFTIPGAKRRIRELGMDKAESKAEVKSESAKSASREVHLRAELLGLRAELMGVLAQLDAMHNVEQAPAQSREPAKKETRFERELRFADAQAKAYGMKPLRRV